MKLIVCIILSLITFNATCQLDSLKGMLNIPKLFSRSASLTNKIDSVKPQNLTASKISSRLKNDSTNTVNDTLNTAVLYKDSITYNNIKKVSFNDTSKATINVYINGGSNIQLNFAPNGTISIMEQGLRNDSIPLTEKPKKKGFFHNIEPNQLITIITLLAATVPILLTVINK